MSSSSSIIPYIMRILFKLKPMSILDVGCGTGKMGYLIRDACDLSMHRNKDKFKIQIDGIELEKSWITPVHSYVYDTVYIDNAEIFEPKQQYDLIIMTDFIEHLKKDKANKVIDKMLNYCKNMIVSSPYGFKVSPKERYLGHIKGFKHLSGWSPSDFEGKGIEWFDVELPNFIIQLKGRGEGI